MPKYKICFQGYLDSNGTGSGKITRFNVSNGLEERSVEGQIEEGYFEGKIKYALTICFTVVTRNYLYKKDFLQVSFKKVATSNQPA